MGKYLVWAIFCGWGGAAILAESPAPISSQAAFFLPASLLPAFSEAASSEAVRVVPSAQKPSENQSSYGDSLSFLALAEQPADKQTQPDLANRVRRLVRQLDAPEAAQRAKAEEALLALGPEILDLLPQLDPQESPQAAVCLARIREQLERRLAESVLQPSVVTLPDAQLPYWEVFQRIYQQTGNRFQLRSDVQEWTKRMSYSAKAEKKPFWPLLDHLLDQAGLTLSLYPADSGDAPIVVPRPEHERARSMGVCYVGPLRIAPHRIVAQREYRSRLGDHLVLVFEVAWEPRLQPVVLRLPHQTLEAKDDQGRSLLPSRPEAQSIVPVKAAQHAAELEVRLSLPERSASRLETVRGQLWATLPGAMQRFRFSQLSTAQNQSQRRAGATVTVRDVRKEGSAWLVEVLLRYDRPSEAFQSHYHWFYRNRAVLQSDDGQTLTNSGVEPFRHTDSEIGLRYTFEGVESVDKYTFIYDAPGLLLTHQFPFALQKLPLP